MLSSPAMWIALICVASASLLGCAPAARDPHVEGSSATRLKPHTAQLPEPTVRRTVYVPIYSSIYLGLNAKQRMVELAVTVSVRNVSSRHALVLNSVRYFDSSGKQVQEYLSGPGELGPLATVEFVITRADTSGGPGANFLIQWLAPADIDDPLIEAVMIGQAGNAGISFTSVGRVVKGE